MSAAAGGRAPAPFIRADGVEKVRGEARYTADLVLPGMAHAAFRLAGVASARIKRLDVTKAHALPGVFGILTQEDVPDLRHGGAYPSIKDRTLFAHEVVRFEGEILCAVAAASSEIARDACRLIEVEYEDLEPVIDAEEALSPDSPLVHEQWETYEAFPGYMPNRNVCAYANIRKGDIDEGFQLADLILEHHFTTDMSHPAPIEPHAVMAQWQGNKVTIWSTSQVPFPVRTSVATALGIPESRIRVVVPHLGGGFGGKCDVHFEPHIAALARKIGRPVRLILKREEEFLATDMARHPISVEVKTGVRSDGMMVARQARVVLDTGAYAGHGPFITEMATMAAAGPYDIPHIAIDGYAVYTNKTICGSTRGPSGPQVVWAIEQHHDELARALATDPVEFRLKNILKDGDIGPTGQEISDCGLRECVARAAELIRWNEKDLDDEGIGLALGWWPTLTIRSGAYVEINTDGTATVVTGAQENGSGAVMGLALLAAEELGLESDQIALVYQDTDACPWDLGSAGSQTTFNAGRAVVAAAQEVGRRLREHAAADLEADPEDLELVDGAVRVKGVPEKQVTIADLALRVNLFQRTSVLAHGSPSAPPLPENFADSTCAGRVLFTAFENPNYYCQAVRLRVDRDTGCVHVTDVVSVHDIGRVVNRTGAEGQVQGGVAHGLGVAFTEHTLFDEGGHQRNPSFLDYKLQTCADVPPVTVAFVEAEVGNLRPIKGAAEPAVIPTAAAAANAIADAVGIRVKRLPMTPNRVWTALNGGNTVE